MTEAAEAIEQAASFLRAQLRYGNYSLACVGSDGMPRISDNKGHVFVASFMAEALDGLLQEIDRTIILVRILSEENGGKWGFAPPHSFHRDAYKKFHVDSDDTAYVVRTLRRLGANRDPECLLAFYRETTRLFVTFDSPAEPILTTDLSPQNNLMAHPEVNANVFLTLRGTHLEELINMELLRGAQSPQGYWKSFFYPSELFGTVLALDVLGDNDLNAVQRALEFIVSRQNADGSWGSSDAYESSLAISALSGRKGYEEVVHRGVEFLLSAMNGDGSWSSTECVWHFPSDDSGLWRAYDRHGSYVSSRCLTALRQACGQLGRFP